MYRRFAVCVLILPLFAGCGQSPPALQAGDEVRPEVALAPKTPWPVGTRVAIGMLLHVHRPGRQQFAYLGDRDVDPAMAHMLARITFLNGDSLPLDEPLQIPFVRDC